MIVYENGDSFVMISQHDHALLSGQFARGLKEAYWPNLLAHEDVLLAIKEHDRGWIPLDEVPFWNDRRQAPYSFLDFPLATKLTFYQKGIEEIGSQTSYGAYLCSKHYQSFFNGANSNQAISFYNSEESRQINLRETFEIPESLLTFHFQLLQFCDDLSLYACFQEPGVSKEDEISWYRNGFPQPFYFLKNDEKVMAHWLTQDRIGISHPLFNKEQSFEVQIKRVSKADISTEGIANAYQSTPFETRSFYFQHQVSIK
ncbi:MAG: DUF3891 family protein [Anaerobacillus sp.]